jgi:hypothetical protein
LSENLRKLVVLSTKFQLKMSLEKSISKKFPILTPAT